MADELGAFAAYLQPVAFPTGYPAVIPGEDGQQMSDEGIPPHPELVERLVQHFSVVTATRLGPDDDYFVMGLVNSLRALEIVAYLERTFDFEIDIDDLDLDNFRTARRAAAFVTRKCGTAVDGGTSR
ncbi:acyl carrier protein [Nocardia sp. NPDC005998]|uniref:acyl carrier protein n=1 Tax=Nocardia sp. NPDC005998 TaxID=3156894 RepID=UPI0033A30787